MGETTADVRRDIELTRERMSSTLAQLEQKLNLMQVVRDHPWPAVALAVGTGLALSGSGADVKTAAATMTATKGATSKVGAALDDIVASFMTGLHGAVQERVDGWVDELKQAIGAPTNGRGEHATGYTATAYTGSSASGSDGLGSGTGSAGSRTAAGARLRAD